MQLSTAFDVYSCGPAATPGDIERLEHSFPDIPAGYREMVAEATDVVLLWNRHGELRLWGPAYVLAMDKAYGVSAAIPGAMPYGDNGGGELLVHGKGTAGLATYLVDTGSLFLDEDAPFVARDLDALLKNEQGADKVFQFDRVPEDDPRPPAVREGQHGKNRP